LTELFEILFLVTDDSFPFQLLFWSTRISFLPLAFANLTNSAFM
jgi:hypothetical protein